MQPVPIPVPVVLPAASAQPLDLRELCHTVGFKGVRPVSQGRYRRLTRLVERSPVAISSDPLPVHACLDGTQALRLLVRRDHRDHRDHLGHAKSPGQVLPFARLRSLFRQIEKRPPGRLSLSDLQTQRPSSIAKMAGCRMNLQS